MKPITTTSFKACCKEQEIAADGLGSKSTEIREKKWNWAFFQYRRRQTWFHLRIFQNVQAKNYL